MKRLLITTLIIGVAVALGVGALHASKTIAGFEALGSKLVSDYAAATRIVGEKWQYVFVLLIALGVSWLSLSPWPWLKRPQSLFARPLSISRTKALTSRPLMVKARSPFLDFQFRILSTPRKQSALSWI